MKEKILEVLKAHPNGMRLREIGGELNIWHPKLLPDIHELENEGKIVGFVGGDFANMERYIIYKIAEKEV